MFAHNAGLTASHPYASSPSSWPFAKKGISFWTQNEGHKQIYLVGNLVGWWTAAGAVFLIFGIFPASIFAERRNIPVLAECELSGFENRPVVLTPACSRHPSFVEFLRLLCGNLGGALRAVFPLQPATLLAPLSSRAPRFLPDCRCCSQLHLHRDRQLPDFVPWIGYTPEAEGVRRRGCEGRCDCWYLHRTTILPVHLHGSTNLRHTWVSFCWVRTHGPSLLTHQLLLQFGW